MSVIRVVPGLTPPYEDSIMNFVCTCCGKKVSTDTKAPACDCGGLFELDFVPPAWDDSKIDRDTWRSKETRGKRSRWEKECRL